MPHLLSRACFPATHLFPLEGHSNWLSYMHVAKKQCGGILKIEQMGLQRHPRGAKWRHAGSFAWCLWM